MPPALLVTPRLETSNHHSPTHGQRSSVPVHPSTGVPRNNPHHKDHKAAIQDHAHHIMVKGSEYELGFFTVDGVRRIVLQLCLCHRAACWVLHTFLTFG